MPVLSEFGRHTAVLATIGTVDTDFTASFVAYGDVFNGDGAEYVNLRLLIDINDSQNPRVLLKGLDTTTGNAHIVPYSDSSQYYEIPTDVDGYYLVPYPVRKAFPYYQLYVCAGTVGADEGQIENAEYSLAM